MVEALNVVEARKNFSEIMARVAYTGQRVVIERKGRPMIALISIADLRHLEALEQQAGETQARRTAALAAAAAARARIRTERNGVLLPDSAEILVQLREERLDESSGLR